MSAVADAPRFSTRQTGAFPAGAFISGLQAEMGSTQITWQNKLHVWTFSLTVLQRLEADRYTTPEPQFNKAYESLLLILLALGQGLKEEIPDDELREHLKANLDNLSSKYITLKAPPLEGRNRLIDLLAA